MVIFPKDAPVYDVIPTAGSPLWDFIHTPLYYSFKAMRMIYIFGSPLRSIGPSPSLPKSSDLAFRGYNPYFTDRRIKSPGDERVRPRASDVETPGGRTRRRLPEHPWPLRGVFTNLSLQEEDTSLEKVPGESTQPV